MTYPLPSCELAVKPRKPVEQSQLPILAYSEDGIYRERDDTYHGADQFALLIASEKSSLVVCNASQNIIRRLDLMFDSDPSWQFVVRPIERDRYSHERKQQQVHYKDIAVTLFGFKGTPLPDGPRGGKKNKPNRYHAMLDPMTFAGSGAFHMLDLEERDLAECEALYLWARGVRQFCAEQKITLRPTAASIASAFLRDPRFYHSPRRKVPTATNAKARPALPGNHYRLYSNSGGIVQHREQIDAAIQFDQISSHHNCASDIKFPQANKLRARGDYIKLRDGPHLSDLLTTKILDGEMYGLIYAKISVPHFPAGVFPPPCAEKGGQHLAYIHTNELPTLKSLKIRIEYIVAAWVSSERDFGMNRYARWCLRETANAKAHERRWIKPMLLTTYGILAAKPKIHRVGYKRASGGTETRYPAGGGYITVQEYATAKPSEPAVANVIHRGMIEAETRLRSLALARELHSRRIRVLEIYADSVFVHARNMDDMEIQIPILPSIWRVECYHTKLLFLDPHSYKSDQATKLPGITSAPNGVTISQRDMILRTTNAAANSLRGKTDPESRRARAATIDAMRRAGERYDRIRRTGDDAGPTKSRERQHHHATRKEVQPGRAEPGGDS